MVKQRIKSESNKAKVNVQTRMISKCGRIRFGILKRSYSSWLEMVKKILLPKKMQRVLINSVLPFKKQK